MSLLMDALRKAEESKRLANEHRTLGTASEMTLQAINDPPAANSPATAARSRLPDLSLHAAPLDTASLDAELAAAASEASAQRQAPDTRSFDNGQREATERRAARNVFAAKQLPRSRTGLWLFVGFGVLAVLGIGGYFWWQLQAVSAGFGVRPVKAPSLATAPVAAMPPVPVPLAPMAAAQLPGPPTAASARPAPETALAAQRPNRAAAPGPLASGEARAARTPRPPASAESAAPDGALRLNRSAPRSNETLERAYAGLHAGRLDEARSDYERVLRSDAKNTDALLGLATIAARQGQAESAQALYLRALESDPNDATAQAGLLNTRGQADPAAAESRLKIALAGQPDSSVLHFALGNLYSRQLRWSEAQQAYFKAYAGEPDNADVIFNLAVSLDHLRQSKLAGQYYQMALNAAASGSRVVSFDRNQVSKRIGELQP